LPAIKTGRGMRLFHEDDVAKLEAELARKASEKDEVGVAG
jgi:hypothetical protein